MSDGGSPADADGLADQPVEPCRYRHPAGRFGAALADFLANSSGIRTFRRRVMGLLPFPVLESDVRDVVYLNWLVPVHLAEKFFPESVVPAQREGKTVFTVLLYRHGHFGPRWLGPLRRLMPSPLQSNWRFYIDRMDGMHMQQPTVLFVRNLFDSVVHAIGTRLGSDALPSELASEFSLAIEPGVVVSLAGSDGRPALALAATASGQGSLPAAWQSWFPSWEAAVRTLSLQDAALVQPPDLECLALAGISLPIDAETAVPLQIAEWEAGEALLRIGATEAPLAFLIPAVKFTVLWERLLCRNAIRTT